MEVTKKRTIENYVLDKIRIIGAITFLTLEYIVFPVTRTEVVTTDSHSRKLILMKKLQSRWWNCRWK